MNSTFSIKRGHVVPKWLNFSDALRKSEIITPRKHPFKINQITKENVDQEYKEFKESPSIDNAFSLLSAAIITNDNQLKRDIAFFLKKKIKPSELSLDLVEKVLDVEEDKDGLPDINLQIAKIKKWVSKYPKSAIPWVELGRFYTIKGQHNKASRAVTVALNLAPTDRYIVRCGVRFFLHIFDFDSAWYYIHKANKNLRDPWLKATEINVSLLAKKRTPNFKNILPSDPLSIDVFHYSELYETFGLLELDDGNINKAKKQFKIAWKNPAETVITHGEWVIRNKLQGLRESSTLDYDRSLEALTWIQYYKLNIDAALKTAGEWELEETYSRSPYMVRASIACNAGFPNEAAEILRRGLLINPDDPPLLNNLCYSLLKAGDVYKAEKVFSRMRPEETGNKERLIVYLATKGLLEFKRGNALLGKELYFSAIDKSRKIGSRYFEAKAYLNLVLAEIETSSDDVKKHAQAAMDIAKGLEDPDILLLIKQINDNLENRITNRKLNLKHFR